MYHLKGESTVVETERSQQVVQDRPKRTVPPQKKKKRKYHSPPAKRPVAQNHSEREQMRQQRVRKQQRNSVFFRAAVCAAVLVIGITVSIFIFFKIGAIDVTGSETYTKAQIIEASEIELGDNLFSPSSVVAQRKIGKALPYVRAVSFKHELPDKLIICVEEAKAKYAFKISTKYLVTDDELKILEISDKLPHGAAVIEGVGLKGAEIGEKAQFKDSQKGNLVSLICGELAKNGLENVTAVNVKNSIDLTAVYDDRITILFGQQDALEYKCQIAAKAIENALEENKNAEGTINVKQAEETRQAGKS